MNTLKASKEIRRVAPASQGASDGGLFSSQKLDNWRKWSKIMDYTLIPWGSDPSRFDDEDTEGPTPQAITAAYEVAQQLREAAVPVPDWVVHTGDGGIAFRWGTPGKLITTVEFDRDGNASDYTLENSKMVSRSHG